MKKFFTFLMLFMGVLSLSAQTDETKETVYIDFNPHIARLDNEIADNRLVGIYVSNAEYTPLEDGRFQGHGYDLVLYYTCDDLYIPLTPDMQYYSGSSIIDQESLELIDISNVSGEVKEVDGKTVYDFSCDGSNGKRYVIHAEAYLPEVKEEIYMNFSLEWYREGDRGFAMMGVCDDFHLLLECIFNDETPDGTYDYVNNEGAANSDLYTYNPMGTYVMLQFEYTLTTREDGFYDIHGDILLEDGRLIHFYMSNAPGGDSSGIRNITGGNASKVRKVCRDGRVMIEADGLKYGIDGSMRKAL